MIVISNNLIGKMPLQDDAVIRINLAWVKTKEEAQALLSGIKQDVYLDFPDGRSKPPKPTITLEDAIELSRNENVKYFAVSNCEDIDKMRIIIDQIDCEFVPKIETKLGVLMMTDMAKRLGIKTFMLDKEDLYTNVRCNNDEYERLVEEARRYKGVIELQGVVFI